MKNKNDNENNKNTAQEENNMNNQTETQIQEIAAIYIESAEAAQNFKETRDRSELDRHSELFRSADEKFEELIATDSSLYDCELREIRYAITQHNFNDAKARYAEINKNTQEENTMTTQGENYEEKYAEECGPDSIVIGSYIEELIEDFFERGYDEIDNRIRYMIDSADAESIRVFVQELGIGYPVEMFANERTKDAKYVQDHARCGEECIVPESKRIELANADETSMDFQMMF